MSNAYAAKPTDPRTWAIIVWGLYIASYFTFTFSMVIGIIIAYVKRQDMTGTPFESHMTSAIRTFWISLIVALIGIVLAFVGIGVVILIALGIWQLFRAIRGIIYALDAKPISDPTGWL
jgi:uncharacterized membrane protein